MHKAEEDSEALPAARVGVDELTADCASLITGTKQEKADCDSSATRIHKLNIVPAKHLGQTGVVVWAVWSLKSCVAVGEDREDNAQDRASETLDKMSELRAPVQGLSQTFPGGCVYVEELIDAELKRAWSVIASVLLESESTVSKVICRRRFPC